MVHYQRPTWSRSYHPSDLQPRQEDPPLQVPLWLLLLTCPSVLSLYAVYPFIMYTQDTGPTHTQPHDRHATRHAHAHGAHVHVEKPVVAAVGKKKRRVQIRTAHTHRDTLSDTRRHTTDKCAHTHVYVYIYMIYCIYTYIVYIYTHII